MKIQTLSELLISTGFGCLSGLAVYGSHIKWQRLGLTAYLDHHTQTYQHIYTKPVTAIQEMILWTFLALVLFVTFKGLSMGLAGLLSLVYHPNNAEQPSATSR